MPGRRDDLRLKVLGEFEATLGERRLALGGRQQRALLLSLALDPGHSVPLPRLVDRLWGERPPTSAVQTVYAYVSRLRAVLPGAGSTLVTTAGGYLLDVDPSQVDFVVFETRAERGRAALAENRPAEAATHLRAALDLWRGPCLPEFAAHAAGQAAIDRLEALRLLVREDLLEADLACGRHLECLGAAHELVQEHPLRERAWAALVLAQYRCGRQAEALESLRTVRRVLAEELGVDPAPALRSLERSVLRQDSSLDLPGRVPVRPPVEVTPPTGPLPRSPAAPVPQPPGLVGREAELATLAGLVASVAAGRGGGRVAVVEGEAGVGKTALVRRCAAEAERDGVLALWVACTGATGAPALWPWTRALRELDVRLGGLARYGVAAVEALLSDDASLSSGTADPGGFALREGVVELVRRLAEDSPVLLVVDDLQLADRGSLDVLDALAPWMPQHDLLLVAVQRGGPGEAVTPATLAAFARHVPMVSLSLQGLDAGDVGVLLGPLAGEAPGLAEEVTARTGGNPFYVGELVRASGTDSARKSAAALTSGVPSGIRDVVRARLLDLPPDALEPMAVAAVLGGTTDVGVVAAAAGLPPQDCAAALEPAVARGLLTNDGEVATRLRFRHAIVRDAVLADLSPLRVARLHARCATALRERYGPSTDQAEPIAHHVLRAQGLVDLPEAVAAVATAADVACSRGAHQRADDLLATMDRLALQEPASPARDGARLQLVLRRIRLRLVVRGFGVAELADLVETAEPLAASTQGWADLCEALCAAAVAAVGAGDADAARQLAGRAVNLAQESRNPRLVHDAHQAVGRVAFNTGRLREARAALEVCLRTILDHGLVDGIDGVSVAPCWFSVGLAGFAAAIAGDEATATARAEECRALADALDDPVAVQTAAYLAAWGPAWSGDRDRALHLLESTRGHRPEQLSPYFRAVTDVLRAWLVAGCGRPEAGLRDVDDALQRMVSLATLPWVAYAYALRAEILLWCGDLTGARRAIADADQQRSPAGEWYGPEILRIRAEILAADPTTANQAPDILREGIRLATQQGAGRFTARCRAALDRLTS